MTVQRATQIERLIRKLRNHPDLWCGAPAKEDRITNLIKRCKKRMAPHWLKTRTDYAGQRLLQTYA